MHMTWTRPGEKCLQKNFSQGEADPTYQGSSGTACEESNLPRRSHMGTVIASSSRIAFANQLGMDKNSGWSV